jgi:hypothetical protein
VEPGVSKFIVQGTARPRGFCGVLLAETTTETPKRPRWIEMRLYREWTVVHDEAGVPVEPLQPLAPAGYWLHNVGKSVVYHGKDAGCSRGARATEVRYLPADAEPHAGCAPPLDQLADGTMVDMEENRSSLYNEPDLRSLLIRLAAPAVHYEAGQAPEIDDLSQPAQQLLHRAADLDDEIAAVVHVIRW